MKCGEYTYIWQQAAWPNWTYQLPDLIGLLADIHRAQGHLSGRMRHLGLDLQSEATLRVFTEDVLTTSEIEGERLNPQSVRSSLARKLGVDIGDLAPSDRQVDGMVEVVLDATQHFDNPLTDDRLFGWHAAMFPTGYSGLSKIRVGDWRDDAQGPMQVVSGPVQRQRVHFEAPPANTLQTEMQCFLTWFNADTALDPLIKAGLAHLWFVTLHPFDDGNGRLARAIGDMALARAEQSAQRYYSLSAQIQRQRKAYYEQLESTQKGGLDVTSWLHWFLTCLRGAIQSAEQSVSAVLIKAQFWQHWGGHAFNARQVKLLNRLLDGFEGKLTSSRWASMANCSQDTALRDIADLLDRGVLEKSGTGGRSTCYLLRVWR